MHEFGVMAARATRSSRTAARVALSARIRDAEAVATGPLGALSHDELGVIFDGLADPLQPVVAVALSSTCLGLRTPLRAALELLKERHERAVALCRKVGTSCMELRDAEKLEWFVKGLTADDMATLGMLLSKWLPRPQVLALQSNDFGDAGVHALCEGLGRGVAPSLHTLGLGDNNFGPAGAEALAAALRRGAMPKLEWLNLGNNRIGNRGVAALPLAAPLRKLHELSITDLHSCAIGDEDVASLVANLGKDDFKALEALYLYGNYITDAGCAMLVAALDAGRLPKLINCDLSGNPASASAVQAVQDAMKVVVVALLD